MQQPQPGSGRRPHHRAGDITKALERELGERGVNTWRYERRSKHEFLIVLHRGREHKIALPNGRGNWRSLHYAVRDLRRVFDPMRKTEGAT